jgi:2-iminobutanoate/2-iminopropanoate deaminase
MNAQLSHAESRTHSLPPARPLAGAILPPNLEETTTMLSSQTFTSPKAPKAVGPYSQAVTAGNFVFTSGQLGLDPQTNELADGIEAQTRQALQNLAAVLETAGTSLNKVVKTTVFMQDLGEFAKMNAVYAEFFQQNPPARSTVQVAGLPRGTRVAIDCVALFPGCL